MFRRTSADKLLLVLLSAVITHQSMSAPSRKDNGVIITSLHVDSDIRYRFASTVVSSKLTNTRSTPEQVVFDLELPERAFISNFTMLLEGELIVGEVKEKAEAKQQYNDAKRRGESAGHIRAVPRHTNRFQIQVNVAGFDDVDFTLTYEELLQRTLGSYSHVINLNPQQIVSDFAINVYINESRPLTEVKVPTIANDISKKHLTLKKIKQSQSDVSVVYGDDRYSAHVSYYPSVAAQSEGTKGVNGQFVVFYDVERASDGGDILVSEGYFIHYFSPDTLPVLSKDVVFVLDRSGSMSGSKISQLKDAMTSILTDLHHGDSFNIISFSSGNAFWRPEIKEVTNETIADGIDFVNGVSAGGGTNINDAVLAAIDLLKSVNKDTKNLPTIIFLTDGQIGNKETVLGNIRQANSLLSIPLYALAFGDHADYEFLEDMALQNYGFARKIFLDSDADLQLTDFYSEISSPLLRNVTIKYLNGTALESSVVTSNKRPIYFRGDEIITSGRLSEPEALVNARVSGVGADGSLSVTSTGLLPCVEWFWCPHPIPGPLPPVLAPPETVITSTPGYIEKMWAYMTIKELLDERSKTDTQATRQELRQKALDLSLKYSFVTPLTSMVVTLPEDEDDVITTTTPSPTDEETPSTPDVQPQPLAPTGGSSIFLQQVLDTGSSAGSASGLQRSPSASGGFGGGLQLSRRAFAPAVGLAGGSGIAGGFGVGPFIGTGGGFSPNLIFDEKLPVTPPTTTAPPTTTWSSDLTLCDNIGPGADADLLSDPAVGDVAVTGGGDDEGRLSTISITFPGHSMRVIVSRSFITVTDGHTDTSSLPWSSNISLQLESEDRSVALVTAADRNELIMAVTIGTPTSQTDFIIIRYEHENTVCFKVL